ncbi:MAG: YebC/PmpR family DNA-binding transcriptional regulator [Bacteroidetes bacterium]|jgi:YebC/PmpR family DNA-binding regulatory protein|nr:YebC/PmpR family DNA-binding transcriptional regulator [Bacteroidota bacterium]MBT5527537.1 YebC/PmpR family DNA-binding transcriptional regulator [Cytophagia bacterium]MBT3801706.1 YebC/PmpR family DNA-binding transcriptional regulator [Bacteroidota bacterium]MBT3932969.1 YebC/PmpR family DNA-binding transcriptional regulator [Bacteroidota bacterium]MBT4338564.1 YebC/PmpR family DNA-binding transcriptional regulator [Bacteroidota bacterium]
MSGHSKWSTIKRKKGAKDAARSKVFSKLIKEIQVAVKLGGIDPEANPRLRLALQNGKAENLPKENVERAIKKASGDDSTNYEEVNYEGYAAHGVAVFVECTTDNKLRTVANVRSYFNKYGGSLGKTGSLEYIFDQQGIFTFSAENLDVEEIELELIDAGAEDIELDDNYITVTSAREDFGSMQKKLDELNIEVENAGLKRIPNNTKELNVEDFQSVMKLIDLIEDDEDVQNVYHNIELTDELIESME